MYIHKKTLEMCLASQRGVEHNYGEGAHYSKIIIMEQTQNLLEDIITGDIELREADIDIAEKLLQSYINSSSWLNKIKARKLAAKLLPFLQQKRETLRKISDFNYVAYILNHKKQAVKMSAEELLKARHTIENSSVGSIKLKQRLKQQLHSYAVLKYSALPNKAIDKSDVNKEFVNTFALKHTKRHYVATVADTTKVSKLNVLFNKITAQSVKIQNTAIAAVRDIKHSVSKKLDRMRHNVKVFYYRNEYKVAALSFVLLGFATFKAYQHFDKLDKNEQYELYKSSLRHKHMSQASQDRKTASFSQEYQKMQQTKSNVVAPVAAVAEVSSSNHQSAKDSQIHTETKTTISDNYYDTSLQIHLKSKQAVQSLYDQIDKLKAAGKLKMSEGLDTKRYAHSFTMYKLIRPNSKENKAIENLLNGGVEDAAYIDALVKQAGVKGNGVKADDNSITTSNFAKANSNLQLMHLANLRQGNRI